MSSPAAFDLKPFRSAGFTRRVTPFISAGLVALVVLIDPLVHHYQVDALAFLFALLALILVFVRPFISRFPVVILCELSLFCALFFTLSSSFDIVVALLCGLLVLTIYLLPWDRFPRLFHASVAPLGILATVALQLVTGDNILLLFPLFLTSLLFAALHYTRGELLIPTTLATFALVLPALGVPQALALAFFLSFILWVAVLTIHEVVTLHRLASLQLSELNLELKATQKSRDLFFASVNHELRTPLNSILGFTDLLLLRLPGPLTIDQEEQLTTVRSSGRHLLSLINDILDLARLEQDRWTPALEPVLLSDLAASIATTLRPLSDAKSLTLTFTAPDFIFITDKRALTQILLNLLNNAIKFTPSGSVSLTITPTDAAVLFAVADTGLGIPTSSAALLFAAFARLAAGATFVPEGTGLGLYVSQRLAHLLQGEITFSSTPDKGSIFTLRLPLTLPLPVPLVVPVAPLLK